MDDRKRQGNKFALALTGGGFRATLLHVGSLWRLNEAGILAKLDAVSGISGGSITAALLGLRWEQLGFNKDGIAVNFRDQLAEPIRKFCSQNIDVAPSLLNGVAMIFGMQTAALSGSYRKHLFGSHTLQDFPSGGEGPEILIGASNIQTGSRVIFSREYMRDYRLGILDSPDIPIAVVVAASSAFPPFLSPVIIRTDLSKWHGDSEHGNVAEPGLRGRMVLTDGGVHDSTGIDVLLGGYENILVSDASITREIWRRPSSCWLRQSGRSTVLQTVTSSAMRRTILEKSDLSGYETKSKLTWWCIADKIGDYEVIDPIAYDSVGTAAFGSMRTRLNHFTKGEQAGLINWGYALCDAAIRRDFKAELKNMPDPKWPVAEYAL